MTTHDRLTGKESTMVKILAAYRYAAPPDNVRTYGYAIEDGDTFIGWVYPPRKERGQAWAYRNE